MRMLLILAATALAGAAAQVPPPTPPVPPRVSVGTGQSVVVRLVSGGAVSVESRGPAVAMIDYDRGTIAGLVAAPVPEGDVKMPAEPIGGGASPPPPVRPGSIRFTLRDLPGKSPHDAVLVVENGYAQGLRYRAVMRRGDRSAATDVCLVMPGKRSYEHWPYQIDRLDLSDLTLVPWKPEDGLPCA
jgi:hypothetical protein